MNSKCPIQRAIDRLKRFAGMPVPDMVRWIDGKPDFRQIDKDKFVYHVRFKLCAVCGTRLGLSCYWIGGDRSAQSHYFTDPPMHQKCAELSIATCPFLKGERQHYRGDDLKPLPEQQVDQRPARMFLLRGQTDAMQLRQIGSDSLALHAGTQLFTVKEF